MNEVTLAITSCARHALLEQTLRSFRLHNTYAPVRTVVVEDSELGPPDWFWELDNLGEKKWISNGRRRGQVYTCDRAMAEVKTPYVFWSEDDWEFTRAGFMEESLAILKDHPQVLQVWMRDDSAHPVVSDSRFPFPIMQTEWHNGWSGFAFNPGLRRLKDYQRIGSYGRQVGYDPRYVGELELSRLYFGMGYVAAKIPAACEHIGQLQHVRWETAPKAPKVLIAIPACHAYEYGEYKDKRIGHVDAVSYERVRGVRETWAKYLPAFERYVSLKFFYGSPSSEPRQLFNDEVFLGVPDGYSSLPQKVKAIYQWALGKGYDYVFKCDDDTFLYLDRLMASGFEGHDYLGYCYPSHGNYISGGTGYWLSRKAMEILALSDPEGWAEDKWVGLTLGKHGIKPTRDARYLPGFALHYVELEKVPEDHSYLSFHACTPAMMRQLYLANPVPTFQMVYTALNEGYEDKGRNFHLNLKPLEQTFTAGRESPAMAGEPIDPRRDNRPIFSVSHP